MLKVIELELGAAEIQTRAVWRHTLKRKVLSLGVGFTCANYEENHLSFLIVKNLITYTGPGIRQER